VANNVNHQHLAIVNIVPLLSFFSFIHLLPAGYAAGSSAGIVFTHGPILGFFAPQVRHVAPIKVKFGVEERTVAPPCQISP